MVKIGPKNLFFDSFWFFVHTFLHPMSYTPKYCLILLKFWPEVVSIKTNTGFEKSFNILSFGSNGTHPKYNVGPTSQCSIVNDIF